MFEALFFVGLPVSAGDSAREARPTRPRAPVPQEAAIVDSCARSGVRGARGSARALGWARGAGGRVRRVACGHPRASARAERAVRGSARTSTRAPRPLDTTRAVRCGRARSPVPSGPRAPGPAPGPAPMPAPTRQRRARRPTCVGADEGTVVAASGRTLFDALAAQL